MLSTQPKPRFDWLSLAEKCKQNRKTSKQNIVIFNFLLFFIECCKWHGSESYEYPDRICHQSQFQANFEKSSLKIALVGNVFNTVWHLHGPQSD